MVTIDIDLAGAIAGLEELARRYAHLDWTQGLKILAAVLASQAKARFDTGVDPQGKPWKPLARPRPGGRGGPLPLRDSGALLASVTALARGHVERAQGAVLSYGTSLPYAAVHQLGSRGWQGQRETKTGPVTLRASGQTHSGPHIPARPFLGLSNDNAEELAAVLLDWVRRQLGPDPLARK